jgi:hypothetical protein
VLLVLAPLFALQWSWLGWLGIIAVAGLLLRQTKTGRPLLLAVGAVALVASLALLVRLSSEVGSGERIITKPIRTDLGN